MKVKNGQIEAEILASIRKWTAVIISENIKVFEEQGCIVCARLFNVLALYTPQGKLLDCIVTSPGCHRVPDERRPRVACDTHTTVEVVAYKRWKSQNNEG